jgi:hypothetical protein
LQIIKLYADSSFSFSPSFWSGSIYTKHAFLWNTVLLLMLLLLLLPPPPPPPLLLLLLQLPPRNIASTRCQILMLPPLISIVPCISALCGWSRFLNMPPPPPPLSPPPPPPHHILFHHPTPCRAGSDLNSVRRVHDLSCKSMLILAGNRSLYQLQSSCSCIYIHVFTVSVTVIALAAAEV